MGAKPCRLEQDELETASTRLIETETGSHEFSVEGYSSDKGIGIGNSLTSTTFTIGGYDWAIRYYPDGKCQESKDYLSFFLDLKGEATYVRARFDFILLDHSGNQLKKMHSNWHTFERAGKSWGYSTFIERKTFETSKNLKRDSFAINCIVTVVRSSHLKPKMKIKPVMVPPSDLEQQLHYLVKSGVGADVTFEVDGEIFKGHKLILGARSRVFHAQFFGQMREKWAERIKLENIEAAVFRVLLDFVSSDSVSKLEEAIDNGDKQDAVIMYQHLLVAADRYEVARLKIICEGKLSQNIEVNNLATILALAEQHNCPHLKASCFEFVASPDNLVAVMGSREFEHLTQSCPCIVKELVENSNNNK